MSSTCATCNEPLAPAAKFCAFCGTPRAEAVGVGAASASAPTTTMPAAPSYSSPPPMTGSGWGGSPDSAARPSGPPAADRVKQTLTASLEPAIAMVFTASALAFGLPSFIYAYAEPHFNGYGNGPKAALAILLLLALVAGAVGAAVGWMRAQHASEDRTMARVVFGVGVFAAAFALLQFFAALGR